MEVFVSWRGSDRAVKNEMIFLRIGIDTEIAHALKLAAIAGFDIGHARFDVAVQDFHRIRIQAGFKVTFGRCHRVCFGEQRVHHVELCRQGMGGAQPVDGNFDFAAVGRVATDCSGIVSAANLNDVAVFVLIDAGAGDEIGVTQAHFAARREAEEFLGRVFHKVGAVDPQFAAERQFTALSEIR